MTDATATTPANHDNAGPDATHATPGLQRPLIIIGTHRSGTTFLGRIMLEHPDAAVIWEPRHVWSFGNAFKPDDTLDATDASDRIARKIRRTFERQTTEQGKSFFVEKTPSNCLRLPFIDRVYPDARYVHIFRDGRAVVRSIRKMTKANNPRADLILRRLRGTPPWEWPAYGSRLAMSVGRKALGKPMPFWGPRPPGWRDWLREQLPPHTLMARQWAHTITPALDFGDRHKATGRWIDLRYEDLIAAPAENVERILEFAGLTRDQHTLDWVAEKTDARPARAWHDEFPPHELDDMRPELEPTLRRLGYAWDTADTHA